MLKRPLAQPTEDRPQPLRPARRLGPRVRTDAQLARFTPDHGVPEDKRTLLSQPQADLVVPLHGVGGDPGEDLTSIGYRLVEGMFRSALRRR